MRRATALFLREQWLVVRANRRLAALIAAGVAAAIVAVTVLFTVVLSGGPTQTITAQFLETPGLYPNNAVDILGVKTGTVASVKAHGSYVDVTMHLPARVKIPAGARAILMAPNPVSDRTVELYPPYTGGPVMASGSVIPVQRTSAPLGVDQIFTEVDDLAKTLGPEGANQHGSLSAAIAALARLTSGNGQQLQNTLAALAQALPALTADPNQIAQLITSLDQLGSELARHNATIDAFLTDVAGATAQLAGERDTLAAAITNLQSGLSQVATFLATNKAAITQTTGRLATISQALVADQQALATTFSTAALGFENFNNAIDPNAPCVAGEGRATCPVVFGRLDYPQGVESVLATYCPSSIKTGLPILVHSVPGLDKLKGLGVVPPATVIDSLCFSSASVVQGHNGSPGAPAQPDLGLSRFLR